MRKAVSQISAFSVCVSTEILNQALNEDMTPKRKARLIRDGIDVEEIKNNNQGREIARAALGLKPEDVVLMAIGGFYSPDGSLEYLIRAVSQLTAEHRNLRLVLVGDGPYRGYMEKLVKALVLQKYVIFAGNLTSPGNLINAADCYVPVSDNGRCLNNTLNAMACSLPVVGCTGNGELMGVISNGKTGLMVDIGDVDDLAMCLNDVLSKPQLATALGNAARKEIERRFSWDQVCIQYLEVYKDVTRRN